MIKMYRDEYDLFVSMLYRATFSGDRLWDYLLELNEKMKEYD